MKFSPLRDKILTLALTGQLVEQRASEPEVQQIGPAPAPDEVPFAIPAGHPIFPFLKRSRYLMTSTGIIH